MTTPATFDVWAPFAHEVIVVVDDAEYTLVPDPNRHGWWQADQSCPTPTHGQRYGFRLSNGSTWTPVLPDPRTHFQPDGVHGLSEVVDDTFTWTDDDWRGLPLRGQVIYELHVGTFIPEGTFDGVITKLDYLKSLGVTTLELMPVQPFGGEHNWGYDGVDWLAVQASYGGPRGLKRLVDAAHAAGLAVILDVVYNHFGPDGNYNGHFGPYMTTGQTDWGDVINFSGPESDEVRAYVLDAVGQWLGEFHVDGLRLDAVHAYDDRRAYSIMEEIRGVADAVAQETGIPRTIIGETEQNDPRIVSPRDTGGYGLSAQWLDDVHHAIHTLVSGEHHAYYVDFGTVDILADTLRYGYRFRNSWSQYRRRTHGRPLDLSAVPPWRMITYTTTHDQTGNRAAGDRPSLYLSPTQQMLKAAVVLCSPFTPMLFMGEEFGARTPFPFFCSHTDDELNRLTREGRFLEFSRMGWDPTDVPDPAAPETFESARISWDFNSTQEKIFAGYSRLLHLRHQYGAACDDLRRIRVDNSDDWLTLGYDGLPVVLAANFSDHKTTVPVGGELIYSFGHPAVTSNSVTLGPWDFALLSR